MSPIAPGDPAPELEVPTRTSPSLLVFYKVTCPVCQMVAPVVERLGRAFPGHILGVGQDPPDALEAFGEEYGMSIPFVTDEPPYRVSDAYRVRSVPTLVLVEEGVVAGVVEAWDRPGWNAIAGRLARAGGLEPVVASEEGDGLPPFRPG